MDNENNIVEKIIIRYKPFAAEYKILIDYEIYSCLNLIIYKDESVL